MSMLFRIWTCVVLVVATGAATAASISVLADFETTGTANLTLRKDDKVTSTMLEFAPSGDGSQALRLVAQLEGMGTGWGGLRLAMPDGFSSGTDHLSLNLRGEGRTRGVFVSLSETDGRRWTASQRVAPGEWSSATLPLYKFATRSRGPYGFERLRPESIRSVDVWVDSTFQGMNGFSIDNLAAEDRVPDVVLEWTPAELTQQKATTLTLEARETTGGKVLPFNGVVWLGLMNRDEGILPETIEMRDGRAEVEFFPRVAGPLRVFAFEPHNAVEASFEYQVSPAALAVDFRFPEFEGRQVMITNETIAPTLSLRGGHMPLTAHVTLRDHKQDTILSSYLSVAALQAGNGKFMVPRPGLFEVHVRMLREPLAQLPHLPDNLPVRTRDVSTTIPEVLPEGVTTRTLFAHQVYLEEIPTTATVLGEDRFPVLVQLTPPKELFFNRWQFGMRSAELFDLPIEQFETTGRMRLRWHRRLGSSWVADEFAWPRINPSPMGFQWQKTKAAVDTYREASMKLFGVLHGNANWEPDRSPATTETLERWKYWVGELNGRYKDKMWGWQVWQNPDENWDPASDPNAYRELVKATWQALRTSGTEVMLGARVVAGATSGFNSVFLDRLCSDGYGKFFDTLSFNFYPDDPTRSPENNSFQEMLDDAWRLYRKHGLNRPGPPLEPAQLWVTDFAWPNSPYGVTQEQQANYLARTYAIGMHNRLLKLFWHHLLDREALPWRGGFEERTGLLDVNYQPKLSAVAYNLAAFMMTSMTPAGPVKHQGKASIYSFNVEEQSVKWPGYLHIAWTPEAGDEEDIELQMIKDDVYVFDYLGADRPGVVLSTEASETTSTLRPRIEDNPTTRTYRFRVNHEPLYIWDAGAPPPRRNQAR